MKQQCGVLGILIINFLVPNSLGSRACAQQVVAILHLSAGLSVPVEQLKDMHQIVMYIP